MEELGNKTIMCSVLFLDIVEYSKKPVAVQILLKDRFNVYLSSAIQDVPVADRIILDATDGVAINFLGNVEDALKTALSLRESLLNEDPDLDPRLLVRMGINLGPVRLVRDVNGQPSILGDGINVAQRVMGFADASQILVSRPYYDAVLRLFPQYAGLFHYQGSRTDKHVREHEVFAIGYPEDKPAITSELEAARHGAGAPSMLEGAKAAWRSAATRLDTLVAIQRSRFRQANGRQRAVYAGVMVFMVLLFISLVKLAGHGELAGAPAGGGNVQAASGVQPALGLRYSAHLDAPPPAASGVPSANVAGSQQSAKQPGYESWQDIQAAQNADKPAAKQQKPSDAPAGAAIRANIDKFFQNFTKQFSKTPAQAPANGAHNADATVLVDCTDGATVLVDGQKKGVITSGGMTLTLPPGKHLIGINDMTRGSIYSQEVMFEPGKTVTIKPNFCL